MKRKVDRPITDEGNPFSPDVTPEQRHVMLRRDANRESARRMRDRRSEDMDRLVLWCRNLKSYVEPAAQAFPAALTDDEGVVAFLQDDFMGGAQAALIAADTFLHAVITFRNICVEQFGA